MHYVSLQQESISIHFSLDSNRPSLPVLSYYYSCQVIKTEGLLQLVKQFKNMKRFFFKSPSQVQHANERISRMNQKFSSTGMELQRIN